MPFNSILIKVCMYLCVQLWGRCYSCLCNPLPVQTFINLLSTELYHLYFACCCSFFREKTHYVTLNIIPVVNLLVSHFLLLAYYTYNFYCSNCCALELLFVWDLCDYITLMNSLQTFLGNICRKTSLTGHFFSKVRDVCRLAVEMARFDLLHCRNSFS